MGCCAALFNFFAITIYDMGNCNMGISAAECQGIGWEFHRALRSITDRVSPCLAWYHRQSFTVPCVVSQPEFHRALRSITARVSPSLAYYLARVSPCLVYYLARVSLCPAWYHSQSFTVPCVVSSQSFTVPCVVSQPEFHRPLHSITARVSPCLA